MSYKELPDLAFRPQTDVGDMNVNVTLGHALLARGGGETHEDPCSQDHTDGGSKGLGCASMRPSRWAVSLLDIFNARHDGLEHAPPAPIYVDEAPSDELSHLLELGKSLFLRFQRSKEPECLYGAIIAQQRAKGLVHEGHPKRLELLKDLNLFLRTRFQHRKDLCDTKCTMIAAKMIAGIPQNVELSPEDNLLRYEQLEDTTSSVSSPSEHLHGVRGAVASEKLILELMPEDHPQRSVQLGHYAASLWSCFKHLGLLEDLRDALATQKQILDLVTGEHPEQILLSLVSLNFRRDNHELAQYLDDRIARQRLTLELTPETHRDRCERLGDLAVILWSRFEQIGLLHDLEDATAAEKLLLDLTPTGHPQRLKRMGSYCIAMWTRFACHGELQDLKDAIAIANIISDFPPRDYSMQQRERLGGFVISLETRLEYFEGLDVLFLNDRMTVRNLLVALTPEGHPKRRERLMNLAISVLLCFKGYGKVRDLNNAIDLHKYVLDLMPEAHLQPMWLEDLSWCLTSRFERLGQLQDLDEAIAIHNRILDITSQHDHKRLDRLRNLASSLLGRFKRLERLEDLDNIISTQRNILALISIEQPDLSECFHNLVISLELRFQRLEKPEDLDDIICAQEQLLDLTPKGHPKRLENLKTLSFSLASRFEILQNPEDFDYMINTQKKILDLTSQDHPERLKYLQRLAILLYSRFQRLSKPDDLNDIVLTQKSILDLTPDGHPERPERLGGYAIIMWTRFARYGKLEDAKNAIAVEGLVVHSPPEGYHVWRQEQLQYVATPLVSRLKELNGLECLDDVIIQKLMVDLTLEDHPERPERLRSFAKSSISRFKHLGEIQNLDDAIAAQKYALALTPEGHECERLEWLMELLRNLLLRSERLNKVEDLDEIISIQKHILELMPEGHPEKVEHLRRLSLSLAARLQCLDNPTDLDDIVETHTHILNIIPEDHPEKLDHLRKLTMSLYSRFNRLSNPKDLDDAISAQRKMLDLIPEGHPEQPQSLQKMAIALESRFICLDKPEDLDEIISTRSHILRLIPEGHPGRIEHLRVLVTCLHTRFERLSKPNDLDDIILLQKGILDLMPDDHPERLERLGRYAIIVWTRFACFGKREDLMDAITTEKLIFYSPPECYSFWRCESLRNFTISLKSRFEVLDLSDLFEDLIMQKLKLDLILEDHPERPEQLRNFAKSSVSCFEYRGEIQDIDNAIAAQKCALDLIPDGHESGRLEWLMDLSMSLVLRFKRLSKLEDIDEVISTQKHVIDLTPESHPRCSERLQNLAISFKLRFECLGNSEDIHEAITLGRRALDLTPEGHPEHLERLRHIAKALVSRFERLGEIRDLDDAIVSQKHALKFTHEGHSERLEWIVDLAIYSESRFTRLGELKDLEDAIAARKKVLDKTCQGRPEWRERLIGFSTSLSFRFERFGELQDLKTTILIEQLILNLTPEGHAERPERLRHFAKCLVFRFERLGELGDLEEAIVVGRRVLEVTPEGHPDRPERLQTLAISLKARFRRLGEIQDLRDAVDLEKCAIDHTSENDIKRPERLSNLAISLRLRFKYLGELQDLEDAITLERTVLDLTPEGHPAKAQRHYNLGISLRTRFKRRHTKTHFDAAIQEFVQATTQALGNPSLRLQAAQKCVSLLSKYADFGSAESLLDMQSRIIRILPEIVWLGHSVDRRFEESAKLGNLVNAAISAFIRSRSRYQAIEWMEIGRSLVWSQIYSLRQPLDGLEKDHPELAAELQEVSLTLQRSGVMPCSSPQKVPLSSGGAFDTFSQLDDANHTIPEEVTTDTAADRHRRLAFRYEDILKNVRAREGYENFLRPPSIISRMSSIECLDGPVVFINVHSSSCDALVLLPIGSVKHIALPELSEDGARNLCSTWTMLLQSPNLRTRGVVSADKLVLLADNHCTNSFGTVMWKLWTWVVRPILQALDFLKIPRSDRLPHITWCPTGPVTQLPLHAAGIYDFSHPTRSQRVFDFAVSSYTPSLSALLRCRDDSSARPRQPKVLVIAQPETPGYAPLPHTRDEHTRLCTILSNAGSKVPKPKVLDDTKATVESAIRGMHKSSWVHLACHGYQDTKNPTQSAFALVDGPLTLSALMGEASRRAELAFLSACQTAVGDEKIPEESAHLAAGMLAVGFKGVIATMWSIEDRDAPVVVEAYYRELLELRGSGATKNGYTGAAYALHEAMKVLREQVGESNFLRWASFVHFGV